MPTARARNARIESRDTEGKKKLSTQIGHLDKRLKKGWRKRQVTLVVSHKARP
jgi:hypothetical protein